VRAKVQRPRTDDLVDAHGCEQEGKGQRWKHALSKRQVLMIEHHNACPDDERPEHGEGETLYNGAEEEPIERSVLATGNHGAEGRGFRVDPGDGDRGDGIGEVERHAHASGCGRTPILEEDRIEELEDEKAAGVADGDAPLKRPDFGPPVDGVLADGVAKKMQKQVAAAEEPDDAGDGLACNEQGGSEQAVVQQQRSPGKQSSGDRLSQSRPCNAGDVAAAFEEREYRIDLKSDAGGQDDADPGKTPGDGMVYVRVRREEVPACRDKNAGHEHCGNAVPLDGLAQNRGQAGVRCVGAKDALAGVDSKVGDFVGGELQDDDREAKLEDDLECDQGTEGVVITLLGGGEPAGDEGDRDESGDASPAACEDCVRDGAIESNSLSDAS